MKVSCNHCGAKNDLGRIFCMVCGKKMSITSAHVDQAVAEKQAFDPRTLVKPVVMLVVLAVLLAAAWPQKQVVSTLSDGDKAEVRLRTVAKVNNLVSAARGKRAARGLFNDQELGVYLESRAAVSAIHSPPLQIRLDGTRMMVLQQVFFGPFAIGERTVGPFRFTRALTCEAVGRTLKIRSGQFGHFPLPGPLAGLIADPIVAAFVLTPVEQAIEKQLGGITIKDGALEFAVGP